MITWDFSARITVFYFFVQASTPTFTKVKPQQGSMCIFWTRQAPWRVNGMSLNWPSGTPGSYADFFFEVVFVKSLDYQFASTWNLFFWPVSTVSRLEDEYTFRPGYCKPFAAAKVIILHHRFECYICLDITYKIYIDIIILYMYYI